MKMIEKKESKKKNNLATRLKTISFAILFLVMMSVPFGISSAQNSTNTNVVSSLCTVANNAFSGNAQHDVTYIFIGIIVSFVGIGGVLKLRESTMTSKDTDSEQGISHILNLIILGIIVLFILLAGFNLVWAGLCT